MLFFSSRLRGALRKPVVLRVLPRFPPPPSPKLGLLLNLQATGSIRRFVHLPKPHLFYERPMMRLNLVHAPPIKACSMS